MEVYRKKVYRLDELEEGMRLANDIYSPDGVSLISKHTRLTLNHIFKLYNWGVTHVAVIETGVSPYSPAEAEMDLFSTAYSHMAKTVEVMFDDVRSSNKIPVAELTQVANSIVDEVACSSGGIIERLRQVKKVGDYTFYHSLNVGFLATLIGQWVKYPVEHLKPISLAGLLHDVGKCKIAPEIVNKTGSLTEQEYAEIKKHALIGYIIAKNTPGITEDIAQGILQHHERENGSGYPYGIAGADIHPYAKIIAVAEVYDGIISPTPYRKKQSTFKAIEALEAASFGQLDAVVCRTFLAKVYTFLVGSIVRLNNGQTGEVVLIHQHRLTRPLVKLTTGEFIDLSDRPEIVIEEVV